MSRSPAAFGVQKFIGAPFGKYTAPNRCGGFAGVCASAERAGTIDSRNGNASVVPTPRSMVRRDSALFVTNMVTSLLRFPPHLEWRALRDPQHDRREPIVLTCRLPQDATYCRHVVVLQPA